MTRFFIENYKFTIVLSLFVTIFGVGGVFLLKPEAFPNVNLGTVIITTYYDGASARDIETKITKPLEDQIRDVRGIKDVKSVSQAGLSTITTVVDIDNYDADEVIEDLQRAVDRVSDLPPDLPMRPNFVEIKSDEFPVIELAITGPNKDRQRDRIADLLREELEDNKKVSGVVMSGYTDRQFNIEIDPAKLNELHVGINEVVQRIQARNLTIPGGEIENDREKQLLKIEGKVSTVSELENLLVRANFNGQKILLKDIATVSDGSEDPLTLASHKGEPAALLTIQKKAGENLIQLAEEVKEKISLFSEKFPEHSFAIYNNEGSRVANRINVLSSNATIGLFLVIFFLLIFLPGRIGFMAALSLPIAVLATFGAMYAMGMTINTMTILALVIAIGMLVDNSVVIAENFSRLRNSGKTPLDAAVESIRELWAPITATALTTIAAFLPMLVTSGVIGQFIRSIPIVVTVALIISLAESFFFLPMRLSAGRKASVQSESKNDWFSRLIIPKFDALMEKLVSGRYFVLIGFGALLVGSILLITHGNKLDLFPAEQTEIYTAKLEMPEGTPIEGTLAAAQYVSKEISKAFGNDAKHIVARVGNSFENPMDPLGKNGSNVALVFIFVTEEAKNNRVTSDMLSKLRAIKYPEADALYFSAAVNGPPVGAPVTVVFRSNDMQQLAEVSSRVHKKLAETPGVVDPKIDDTAGDREVVVKVDYQQTSRVGLDLMTLGNTLRTAISGRDVSDINLNNKEVDLFVRFKGDSRSNINDIKNVHIMDRGGNLIPIDSLASFESRDGTTQIKRFDYKRAKTVTANIDDTVTTAVAANQVVANFFDQVAKEYPEVSIKFSGEGQNINESMASLVIALVLSIIGIFSLLVLIFNSFLKPVIILTTIPLGLVGFAVAFFIQSRPISFLALIGIVGLGGIIVNSGIVLISFIERMRATTDLPLKEILVRSAGMRLRAVIVTSLTTVSGLLPTAYGIGGADEFIIPMTMSLAWGLTSGTILALLWVPCAYLIVEDMTAPVKRLFAPREPAKVAKVEAHA